jgi:hypothetical protein
MREIVNFWAGQIPGEGQVQLHQGCKEEPLSAILCLRACLAGVSTCLHPLIKRNCLVKIFCLVCLFLALEGLYFQQFGCSVWDFTFCPGKGPWLFPSETHLLPGCGSHSPEVQSMTTTFWICKWTELGLQNFLSMHVKELWRQELWRPCEFCAQTKIRNVTGD